MPTLILLFRFVRLMFTGHAAVAVENGLAAGMDDYVSKPIGLDELKASVGRWLQQA